VLIVADVDSPPPAVDVRKPLARFSHNRGVDDRYHLIDVLPHKAVEEGLVAVVEARQEDEPLEIGRFCAKVFVGPFELLFDGADGRREKPPQVEFVPLAGGKCCALVGKRAEEQWAPLVRYGHVLLPRSWIDLDREIHTCLRKGCRCGGLLEPGPRSFMANPSWKNRARC